MLCPVYGHELTPLSCPPHQGVSFRSFKGLIILSPYRKESMKCFYEKQNFPRALTVVAPGGSNTYNSIPSILGTYFFACVGKGVSALGGASSYPTKTLLDFYHPGYLGIFPFKGVVSQPEPSVWYQAGILYRYFLRTSIQPPQFWRLASSLTSQEGCYA